MNLSQPKNNFEQRVFYPVKTNGGKYSIYFLIVITGVLFLVSTVLYLAMPNNIILIFDLGLMIFMISLFSQITYGFYNMQYTLTDEDLIIKWGILTRKLPLNSIKRIGATPKRAPRGFRSNGVGIPGYFVGNFKLLLDGNYETVHLFATKIKNLLLISTNQGKPLKFYGITPENTNEFISEITRRNTEIEMKEFDTEKKLQKSLQEISKNIKYTKILFVMSFIAIAVSIIYFLIFYPQLPLIVPIHYNILLTPDLWGEKWKLLLVFSILWSLGTIINMIFYFPLKRDELNQSKYGYKLMFLPLIMNLGFLLLTIGIVHLTFQNTIILI
ncbi:MAG: PH domain-containing protein [Promethearchaeota archaeon]